MSEVIVTEIADAPLDGGIPPDEGDAGDETEPADG